MLFKIVAIVCLVVIPIYAFSPSKIYPKRKSLFQSLVRTDDTGEALFLTPFIQEGKLEEGRKLATVANLTEVESYSGYLTVNQKYNSNLFFWFFPAVHNRENAPVLVWLQGGPGGSSLFGLFVENGPFIVDQNLNVQLRNTSWTLTHSVIYIDNPVGTGNRTWIKYREPRDHPRGNYGLTVFTLATISYSFTDNEDGYAKTEEDVSNDLYNALVQFFTLFPEFHPRDFYLTGESYAGKYIPAIAHKIHQENQGAPVLHINLKGVAIGDGFSDPYNMLNYGNYLFNIGLINEKEQQYFHQQEAAARLAIRRKEWRRAFEIIDLLMDGDMMGTSYFTNVTGYTFYFNFLMPVSPPDHNYYSAFVQLPAVRKSIHVGNRSYAEDTKVESYLREDMYQSVVPWIVELLHAKESYKVLIYSGQLDIIVANINTERMLRNMKWSGRKEFAQAEKKQWKVGKDLAGYAQTADGLTYVLVRNAGHILPYDQPKWSFDMINRFTTGKPFS